MKTIGKNTLMGQKKLGQGFTLIELLVVIAIIAILAAILFPVFARARENARRTSCSSNVKQLSLGILQYVQDYDEKFPPIYRTGSGSFLYPNGVAATDGVTLWMHEIYPYVKSSQLFNCPSTSTGVYKGGRDWDDNNAATSNYLLASYGVNYNVMYGNGALNLARISSVVTTPMLSDGTAYAISAKAEGEAQAPIDRHLETVNMGFVDGHVKSVKLAAWTTSAAHACTDAVWALWDPACS